MKRSKLNVADIADWHNLALAFSQASKACRNHANNSDSVKFSEQLEFNLTNLREQLLNGTLRLGNMRRFWIRDPKKRLIHAPCFKERVLHHALINHIGPVLDNALVDDTFACRKGRGSLAAVLRCQHHLRRFNWYVQVDIRHFFSSIDHQILLQLLQRKFKNKALLHLIEHIIVSFHDETGHGLPIGSLTSQHFANYYLAGLDRYLLETLKSVSGGVKIRAMVRYMDDILWCCDSKQEARQSLCLVKQFIGSQLGLEFKASVKIGRCKEGAVFCGYRVLPACLLLTRRRKQRYIQRRAYWEKQYLYNKINATTLQTNYSAALAITAHSNASAWRKEQLIRQPLAKQLMEV